MLPASFEKDYTILKVLISHLTQAQKNNIKQFKTCTNINTLLEILLTPFNNIQLDVIDLQDTMNLEKGYGSYLDMLGRTLGRGRSEGESDTDYKTQLYVQILKNTNQGTISEVLTVLAKAIGTEVLDNSIFVTEIYPASVDVVVESVPNIIQLGGHKGIDSVLPAGVGTNVKVFEPGCQAFGLEGSGGAPLDIGCWVSEYRERNNDFNIFGLDTPDLGGFPLDLGRFLDAEIGLSIDPEEQAPVTELPNPTENLDHKVLGFYTLGGIPANQ